MSGHQGGENSVDVKAKQAARKSLQKYIRDDWKSLSVSDLVDKVKAKYDADGKAVEFADKLLQAHEKLHGAAPKVTQFQALEFQAESSRR